MQELLEVALQKALQKQHYDYAEDLCIKLLLTDPTNVDLLNQLVTLSVKTSNWSKAGSIFYHISQRNPAFIDVYFFLGFVLDRIGKAQDAIKCYRHCLNHGLCSEVIKYNLALCLKKVGYKYYVNGMLSESIDLCKEALNLYSDDSFIHTNLAMSLLKNGNFQEGFLEYEYRTKLEDGKDIYENFKNKPAWQGEIFPSKNLLVYQDQGMGDTIQFARYLPMVKSMGGTVTLLVLSQLNRLLASMNVTDRVLSYEPIMDFTNYDIVIPITSLAKIFRTSLDTIPNNVPYLFNKIEHSSLAKLISPTDKFKVGLVWAGSKSNGSTTLEGRSISLEEYVPLTKIPNCKYYSLQLGKESEKIKDYPDMGLVDLSEEIGDFADTAAIISQLDLVITIDTSVAHLAGAMGKPVWVLTPFNSDWRWLMDREDSPWYPTMRLFRQSISGEWDGIIRKVAAELFKLKV